MASPSGGGERIPAKIVLDRDLWSWAKIKAVENNTTASMIAEAALELLRRAASDTEASRTLRSLAERLLPGEHARVLEGILGGG
jgi:hypothetical protein